MSSQRFAIGCCQLLHCPTHHPDSMDQIIASEAAKTFVILLNKTISQHMNCHREIRVARYSNVQPLRMVQNRTLASCHTLDHSAILFDECYRQAQGDRLQPSAYLVSSIIRIWLQKLNIVPHGMYTICILFTCIEWAAHLGSPARFDSVKLKPWTSGLRTLFHIFSHGRVLGRLISGAILAAALPAFRPASQ